MAFIEGEAKAGGHTQVIVTSHSPNFASSAQIDRLAVVSRPSGSLTPVSRVPGTFGLSDDHLAYLRRFLDVTKASLFFARGVILVEGIAEQLLVPVIARRLGMPLAPAGISVINIGGVAFAPFTELFGVGKLPYRLAAVSDSDPVPLSVDAEDEEGEESPSARAKRLAESLAPIENAEAFFAKRTLEWDLAAIASNRTLMIQALARLKPKVAAKLPAELEQAR